MNDGCNQLYRQVVEENDGILLFPTFRLALVAAD